MAQSDESSIGQPGHEVGKKAGSQSGERRDHDRVLDAVRLEIVGIDNGGDNHSASSRQGAAPVVSAKHDIRGFEEVRQSWPEVARYIDRLEEQLRILLIDQPVAGTTLDGENSVVDITQVRPDSKVSLSATGIAFAHYTLLQPGDVITLRLTLFPEGVTIACEATIVSTGDVPKLGSKDQHTYRAVFKDLGERQAKILEAHVDMLLGVTRASRPQRFHG